MNDVLEGLRAVAEPTRLRLLAVLRRAELTVSEMATLFGQSQPRISHHLKTLCEAGLLDRIQEGTSVYHRVPARGPGQRLAETVVTLLPSDDPVLKRDAERLEEIRRTRAAAADHYFRANAPRWARIRALYLADPAIERAVGELVGTGTTDDLLDVGTGTGHVLGMLASRVAHATGVDSSREMLAVARAQLDAAGHLNCRVRQGDATDLPLPESSFDTVTIHHVLHFLDFPQRAVAEALRVLRLGGRIIIVDFAPHALEHLATEFAHRWLGFPEGEIVAWLRANGVGNITVSAFPGVAGGALKRPPTMLWTGVKAAARAWRNPAPQEPRARRAPPAPGRQQST